MIVAAYGKHRQPRPRSGMSLGDSLAAMFAVQDILMALHRRDARMPGGDGGGQIVDASIMEGCFAMLEVAEQVLQEPPDALVVADTIGVGVPSQARELVRGLLALGARVGGHFHNTRTTGLANAVAALEAGVSLLDASCQRW